MKHILFITLSFISTQALAEQPWITCRSQNHLVELFQTHEPAKNSFGDTSVVFVARVTFTPPSSRVKPLVFDVRTHCSQGEILSAPIVCTHAPDEAKTQQIRLEMNESTKNGTVVYGGSRGTGRDNSLVCSWAW